MPIKLSKSRYLYGLQCLRRLWLAVHRPETAAEISPAQQLIFKQGHRVGELAQGLFPGGVLVPGNEGHDEASIEATRKAVADGAQVVYEAGALRGRVWAWADILVKDAESDAWDMVEVKSTLECKETHVQDLSVQKWIFGGAGYRVRKCKVCTLDRKYVRQGDLEVPKLFRLWDVTGLVEAQQPGIEGNVKRFLETADSPDEPDVPIGSHCADPYDCPFVGHCWQGVPEDSVFNLCHDKDGLADLLYKKGVREIKDIPLTEKLNKNQRMQVEAAKSGKPFWDKKWVKGFLEQVRYPVQFLDFESDNPALPPFDGESPYQKVYFQYSLHIVEGPGAEPVHHEFLGDGRRDPRRMLAEQLSEDLRPEGSVVVYHAAFEKGALTALAEMFPDLAGPLLSARERVVDLITPFTKRKIVHPGFRGSASLKFVLPALVPEMTYEGMTIGNGGEASAAYRRLGEKDLGPFSRESVRISLLSYCAQDTLAMVKLFELLQKGD